MTKRTHGQCNVCNDTFSKAGMTRHLQSCREGEVVSKEPSGNRGLQKTRLLHLLIEGQGLPDYWMHVEAPADVTLEDLDHFLRDTWLECCGHLSAFTIGDTTYLSHPGEEFDDEGMDVALGDILRPGMEFHHKYDFGTTTHLSLRVVSEREGKIASESIQILARNDPRLITCEMCGEIATLVCAQCIWSDEGWLCDKCAGEHKCGEEMLLPVVDSPRVGMCGYTGEAW
jgi:hypothetical protein